MPPIEKISMLEKISHIFSIKKSNTTNSDKPQMRKHHWVLGAMIILGSSWITHTTTAKISPPLYGSETQSSYEAKSESGTRADRLESNIENGSQTEISSTSISALNAIEPKTTPARQITPSEVVEQKPKEVFTTRRHTVKKGESLGIIFRRESLDLSLPYKISHHDIAKQLVSLSIGKELELKFDQSEQLRQIAYRVSALELLKVSIEGNEIVDASVTELPYVKKQHTVSAEINLSLYQSALDSGLSNNLIMEMVRIFGWDVDFVLDIRRGDSFHIIYDEYHLGDEKLSDGNILAAEFTTQGRTYRAIRFEDDEGNASFYTPEGESMLGTFLRSPVEFSRISSRFGKRKHPISKKWKTHKGVDYAAAKGTPIRATADGKVTLAGRKGGYGKTIVLRHAGRFTTLYAHMSGYAKGVRSGARVKQGQVIGYVGSTGYSTGNHLHYEFRVDGVHRNSLTYKTPKASSISNELKAEFDVLAANWSEALNKAQTNYQLAKSSESNVPTKSATL